MTFSPQIRVRGHNGSLLKRHSVFLVIRDIHGTTIQTLTTDSDGRAPFQLDTAHWNGRDVSLEVSTGRSSFPAWKPFLKENLKIFLFPLTAPPPPPHTHPWVIPSPLLTSPASQLTKSFLISLFYFILFFIFYYFLGSYTQGKWRFPG